MTDEELRALLPEAFLADVEDQKDLNFLLLQCAQIGYERGVEDGWKMAADASGD